MTSATHDVRDMGSLSRAGSGAAGPPVGAHVIADASEALLVARQLAAAFQGGAAERDLDRRLPIAEIDLLSQHGLYSLTVPSYVGGPDLAPSVVADVLRILATADPNIAQIPQSHYVYVNLLRQAGVGRQQERLLSQVLDGARFGNAQSEANSPTLDKIRTLIEPDGDDFVVNGDKFYCTGAYFAHVIPVLAKNAEGRAFVAFVPRETEGLDIVDDWSGMGQRTTASGTVRFVDVKVPAWRVVARDPLFAGPQIFGAFAQLLHTAIDVGIARGALNEAVAFVQTKSRPWFEAGVERAADDALLIQRVGELTVDVRTAEAVCREAGEALDFAEHERATGRMGRRVAAETSIAVATAKVVADRVGVQTASALFEVCGTRSAAESLDLSRHWRNVRTHTLHDPVRWKLQHIGRWVLHGTPPPSHGLL